MTLDKIVKIIKGGKRVGRGIAAGRGKTAGRGTKGQSSRKSRGTPRFFEGGQTKVFARLPKIRGEKNAVKPNLVIAISSKAINAHYSSGEKVNFDSLVAKGIINRRYPASTPLKIIGSDKLKEGLDVSGCRLSQRHLPIK